MAVPIERELGALVTQLRLDGLDRRTVGDEQRRAGVAEGMETGGRDACIGECALLMVAIAEVIPMTIQSPRITNRAAVTGTTYLPTALDTMFLRRSGRH